jgi:hypothetical protein
LNNIKALEITITVKVSKRKSEKFHKIASANKNFPLIFQNELRTYSKMLSRLAFAQTAFTPMFKNALQQAPIRQTVFRQFNREARQRSGVTRNQVFRENPTLKERLMAPPGANGKKCLHCIFWPTHPLFRQLTQLVKAPWLAALFWESAHFVITALDLAKAPIH